MVERERSRAARPATAPDGPARAGPPRPHALAATVGNRAFARLARESPPRRQVQRMLIQLGFGFAESENARRLRESNPLEYRGGPISAIKDGEVLHLVAHAGGDDFAGHDPDGLFGWLMGQGLPAGVRAIQLHGCESAGFAAKLKARINTPSRRWTPAHEIDVVGVPGYHFVSSSGRSYSVGATRGSDKLWAWLRDSVMRDPSDENVARLAQLAQQERRGNLIEVQNLRSAAATVRATRQKVRAELEAEVQAVAMRNGQIGFARDDLASLERRIMAFLRITGAIQRPGAARGAGEKMAERALARALEVLDQLVAGARSKHLKGHLAKGGARESLANLRTIRASLREHQAQLPDSIAAVLIELEEAHGELSELKRRIVSTPGSSAEARQWVRGFEARLGSAVALLSDAQLQHLKDPLLDKLRRIERYPPDAPPPLPPVEEPPKEGKQEEFDWDALIGSLETVSVETEPVTPPPARTADSDLDAAMAALDTSLRGLEMEFGPPTGAAPPPPAEELVDVDALQAALAGLLEQDALLNQLGDK